MGEKELQWRVEGRVTHSLWGKRLPPKLTQRKSSKTNTYYYEAVGKTREEVEKGGQILCFWGVWEKKGTGTAYQKKKNKSLSNYQEQEASC